FLLRLVPIHDPADERRDQLHLRLRARNRLRHGEQQREVAMDAVAFQDFRRANALPRRGHLDEHPFAPDAVLLVKLDEFAALGDERGRVERKVGVGFGRYPFRDDFQDLHAESDEQMVDHFPDPRRAGAREVFGVCDDLVDNVFIFRHLRRLEDERRVRRGVARRKLFERGEVAGIGHHHGNAFQLIELAYHRRSRAFFHFSGSTHKYDDERISNDKISWPLPVSMALTLLRGRPKINGRFSLMPTHYLACDLGADSGRLILGTLDNGKISIEELHRFPNGPIKTSGALHWNVDALFNELKNGLKKAAARNLSIASISSDSWGVDYVLIDERGLIMQPVWCYRDSRTAVGAENVKAKVDWPTIFSETGI